MNKINWSPQQDAVFAAVEDFDGPHLIVSARAGTGKTTLIVEAVNYTATEDRVLVCAFNKGIEQELSARIQQDGIRVRTLHSQGYAALARKLGRLKVDSRKTQDLAYSLIPEPFKSREKKDRKQAARECARLVSLAKNTLARGKGPVLDLCYRHQVTDDNHADLADWALRVLDQCLLVRPGDTIDFDDMIWLPARLEVVPGAFDVVFVDEIQDLNAAQLWMIRKMLRNDGRLVGVGDPRQALYSWRGAGQGIMGHVQAEFEAVSLPLTTTYRCGKRIVELAQEVVPDYRAPDWAHEGTVRHSDMAGLLTEAKPGDFVLSRTNAPLAGVCLALLRQDVPARIAGRAIGFGLARLIDKSKSPTVSSLDDWLGGYLDDQRAALEDRPDAFDLVYDRVSCLRALCQGMDTIDQLHRRIDRLFTVPDPSKVVVCSTVHRAKGLEADRVWMLEDTFRRGKGSNTEEEDNIWYVAVTRAKHDLVRVRS